MIRTPMILALVAAAALAGCNKENHTIVSGPPDDNETNAATAQPVVLPPSIASSKSYRCKDNKLVYVDWMSDGSAHVKASPGDVGTPVTVGTDLTGDPKGSSITYKGQSCSA
ncbi:MAG: hypothetical protein ABIO80_02900 [Sphingomicrobium sp.]